MRTSFPGRPRTLDRNKKTLLCDAVSRGASMTEAALTVGVSLRTVQREARLDPHFDQQLRMAHTDKPDPLTIMQSAARTHWRAAAWLLERTQPEDYGRRPASSCSPYQFEEALKVVIDAALRLAPPENHAHLYAELTAASETAFKAIFPNYGPYGRHLVKRLPDTPLANAQRLEVLRNSPPSCIVSGGIEPASHSKPRALPGGRPALQEVVTTQEETPGQRPGLQVGDLAASVDQLAANGAQHAQTIQNPVSSIPHQRTSPTSPILLLLLLPFTLRLQPQRGEVMAPGAPAPGPSAQLNQSPSGATSLPTPGSQKLAANPPAPFALSPREPPPPSARTDEFCRQKRASRQNSTPPT